jgi:hypothetical protein
MVLSSYVYGDPHNEFEREPFIVKFKVTSGWQEMKNFHCLSLKTQL